MDKHELRMHIGRKEEVIVVNKKCEATLFKDVYEDGDGVKIMKGAKFSELTWEQNNWSKAGCGCCNSTNQKNWKILSEEKIGPNFDIPCLQS